MAWKYVMFENRMQGGTKILFPVIFPDKMVHKHVAQLLKRAMPGYYADGVVPVSAGTIEHLEIDGLGGESTTLDLKSKPGDRGVIENYSYAHGVL
jgi:hypothetical protein